MTNPINDGGPAFPTPGDEFMLCTDGAYRPKSEYGMEGKPGMSLRDYFAAKAMQGEFACQAIDWNIPEREYVNCAIRFYRMADAMLEARKSAKPS